MTGNDRRHDLKQKAPSTWKTMTIVHVLKSLGRSTVIVDLADLLTGGSMTCRNDTTTIWDDKWQSLMERVRH